MGWLSPEAQAEVKLQMVAGWGGPLKAPKDVGDVNTVGRRRGPHDGIEGLGNLQKTRVDQERNAVAREGNDLTVGGGGPQGTEYPIDIRRDSVQEHGTLELVAKEIGSAESRQGVEIVGAKIESNRTDLSPMGAQERNGRVEL